MAQLMPVINGPSRFHLVFGASPAMKAVEQVLREVARLQAPILLLGEKGTGKASVAQRVHEGSAEPTRRFYRVDCAAAGPGCLDHGEAPEAWGAGTLYLNEIGQLNLIAQASLAEMLRLADGHTRLPRMISSSTRPLEEDVQGGRFREDLFFRLNGIIVHLPPLRQRQDDILPLAEHFIETAAENYGRPRPTLSPWAERCLTDYGWPGNLPELEKVMASLVVLGDEQAALADLAPRVRGTNPDSISLKQAARAASREAERELILKVLTKTRWNRRKAAEFLQISYKALLYKLKQIGVEESPNL